VRGSRSLAQTWSLVHTMGAYQRMATSCILVGNAEAQCVGDDRALAIIASWAHLQRERNAMRTSIGGSSFSACAMAADVVTWVWRS
jgi:hypothetical protein